MSFKSAQHNIQEKKETDGPRVVKLEAEAKQSVETYSPLALQEQGKGDYQQIRAKYGPLAATDPDRKYRNAKDRRFSINPLLRDPLSIEEEEKRAIEEKVRARIAALADEARSRAESLGYQDGLKKGYEEAFERFQKEGAEKLAKFDELLSSAEEAKAEIFRANERVLIEMIYRISKMVLLRELKTDREYLLRLASDLIDRVGVRDHITLRIHPEDSQTIEMLRKGLEGRDAELKNLNIEISPQVRSGGCSIETQWNAIDASIETQLKGIHDALLGEEGAKA